jgi:hypothetical protein
MNLRALTRFAILLTALVLPTIPAHAQIVSVLDAQGKRVYINIGPPPVKTANPPAGAVAPKDTSNVIRTNQSGVPIRMGPSNSSAPRTIPRDRLEELVQTTATRHHVDPALVRAVMQVESGGNPTAVSRKGAMGLMQLMPETAFQMGVTRVFDPQENLEAGVRTLRSLLLRYNGDLDKSLAAYNAGTGAVDRAGGVPRIRETRDYVRKVTNNYFQSDAGQPAQGSLGATTPANGTPGSNAASRRNATSSGNTTAPAPAHRMYQIRDAQGRLVWVNE